ncbi:nucleotidyl transferase AbiEii/AbiGii toxin family protein [Enterovibrio makurazakiensis]|uniref:nucleotidyl transferase AbiEii/AbiGii toxin family protein n=1 Tax=Enterovibrio makurazakiensis TaxID=2910232 RepID=UPI003D203E4A
MKNGLIDITGKLNDGHVDIYSDVDRLTKELDIEYVVVGAMARDLVLAFGFGAKITRGTRDVDFGICVKSWGQFHQLAERLQSSGFERDRSIEHRFSRICSDKLPWEIDVVPFGGVAVENAIAWPPRGDIEMSVLGFTEACENAMQVKVRDDPELVVPVCSPAGITLLKLISWRDRDVQKRKKDAVDLLYLIENYKKIPQVEELLWADEWMDKYDFDGDKASAAKLGHDAKAIASPETVAYLKAELFEQPQLMERLAREMVSATRHIEDTEAYLQSLSEQF